MSQIINKKICLLGEFAVGKTSLIRRYVHDCFSDDYITSIGVKVTEKILPPIDKNGKMKQFRFMIWDIAGSEDGKIKHESYWTGASGALIVTDLSRPGTLNFMRPIIKKFKSMNPNAQIVIIGNKMDLIAPSEIPDHEATLQKFGETYQYPTLLTSAKSGQGVEESFLSLAKQLME